MFEGIFEANRTALRTVLDAELSERAAASGVEPDLPAPSPDGVLSELAAASTGS